MFNFIPDPLASKTCPVYTRNNCFGNAMTQEMIYVLKSIPPVENTAVSTVSIINQTYVILSN